MKTFKYIYCKKIRKIISGMIHVFSYSRRRHFFNKFFSKKLAIMILKKQVMLVNENTLNTIKNYLYLIKLVIKKNKNLHL